MTTHICPSCGSVLTGERPKFCDQCGCELSRAGQAETSAVPVEKAESAEAVPDQQAATIAREDQVPLSEEQKQATYLEKLKEAWADGKVPVSELEELSSLREQLGITASQAEELSKKAIESLRPVQKDDFEEKPRRGTSRGIALSINTHRFYMEGLWGVLDTKLENLSDDAFDSIKVEVSGELLERNEHWSCRLESCKAVEKRFPVKPADAGVKLVQFRISAKQGNSVYAYWAETDLPIFEKTKELRDIAFQADRFINVGGGSGGSKDMGNAVNINIDSLIRQDKIRTANDLMMEYRKLPPEFKMLELTFDPERSEQLTNSLTIAKRAGAKRIAEPGRGSLTDGASLRIQSKDRPVQIVLVAKSEVTLGKNRRNDIVTRICPRSAANDDQSNRISRNHCQLNLIEKGAFVKDEHSANGTLLDGKTVDAKGRQIESGAGELEIGGVLKMSVRCLGGQRSLNSAAYEEILDELLGPIWRKATKTGLNSITLERLNNLGADDKNGVESYCLVYRIAHIGSARDCAISFADKGLEPLHAAILYLGRRFYLENLSDLTDVVVNDTTLSKNELVPLSFGDRITITRLNMEFLQRSQLYI